MYHVRSLSPSGEGTEHTVDCYNPRTNTWSKRGKMRAPRRESSAVCIGNKIYILGTFPISTFLCFGVLRGEGQTFFRAFINSELGPPEVAPCMARRYGYFLLHIWAGRCSEPVWRRCPETPPKVRAIHEATSGGPNSELIKALKKVCPPPPP